MGRKLCVIVVLLEVLHLSFELPNGIRFRQDYTALRNPNNVYKYHTQRATWADAERVCASEGAALYYAEDKAEAVEVSYWLDTDKGIWIGIYRSLKNNSISTIDERSFSDVYQGLHSEINEIYFNCFTMNGAHRIWNAPCNGLKAFVCKYTPGMTTQAQLHSDETLTTQPDQRDQNHVVLPNGIKFREDYTSLQSPNSVYKYHALDVTWDDAKEICANEGAQLFYPEDVTEAKIFQYYVPSNYAMWLGVQSLPNNNSFVTIDGRFFSDVYKGPYSILEREKDIYHCLEMNPYSSIWNGPCTQGHRPFACKYTPRVSTPAQSPSSENSTTQTDLRYLQIVKLPNGIQFRQDYTALRNPNNVYKYHAQSATWGNAERVCASEGATLYYAEDEAEADDVRSWLETDKGIWIGIYRSLKNNSISTIDERSFSDVYQGRHSEINDMYFKCFAMNKITQFWNAPCDGLKAFVCKYTPGMTTQAQLHSDETLTTQPDQRDQNHIVLPNGIKFREDYTSLQSPNSAYKYHDLYVTWDDAKEICANEGAQLFYPEDVTEAKIFQYNVPSNDAMWLGVQSLPNNNSFVTIDGRFFSDVYKGPYSILEREKDTYHCLEMNPYSSIWNAPCIDRYMQFACKYTPRVSTPAQSPSSEISTTQTDLPDQQIGIENWTSSHPAAVDPGCRRSRLFEDTVGEVLTKFSPTRRLNVMADIIALLRGNERSSVSLPVPRSQRRFIAH